MAARFAGSRFLDERRRRRLASENEEAGVDPECFAASAACASHVVEKPTARALTVPVLPLRKLVSGRYWKLMLLGCLLFLLVGAVVWSGEQLRVDPNRWGPGVAGILELGVGAVPRALGGILFLLSAQLALLIGWVRSRSPEDFDGRYRVWAWVAAAWLAFGVSILTRAPQALSATLEWHYGVLLWKQAALTRLVPSYVIALSILWWLHREMLGCRISLSLLGLAGLTAGVAALCSLELLEDPSGVLNAAALLTAQSLIFLSMLIHARYVLYETNDPPPLRRTPPKKRRRPAVWRPAFLAPLVWLGRHIRLPERWKKPPESGSGEREEGRSKPQKTGSAARKDSSNNRQAAQSDRAAGKPRSTTRRKQTTRTTDKSSGASPSSTGRSAKSDQRTVRVDGPAETQSAQTASSKSSSSPSAKQAAPSAAAGAKSESKPESKSNAKSRAKSEPAANHESGMSEAGSTANSTSDASASSANGPSSKSSSKSSSPHIAPDELKGLTKRQRRELRKQRRQQQRAARQ